jgi:hypothetical protein
MYAGNNPAGDEVYGFEIYTYENLGMNKFKQAPAKRQHYLLMQRGDSRWIKKNDQFVRRNRTGHGALLIDLTWMKEWSQNFHVNSKRPACISTNSTINKVGMIAKTSLRAFLADRALEYADIVTQHIDAYRHDDQDDDSLFEADNYDSDVSGKEYRGKEFLHSMIQSTASSRGQTRHRSVSN